MLSERFLDWNLSCWICTSTSFQCDLMHSLKPGLRSRVLENGTKHQIWLLLMTRSARDWHQKMSKMYEIDVCKVLPCALCLVAMATSEHRCRLTSALIRCHCALKPPTVLQHPTQVGSHCGYALRSSRNSKIPQKVCKKDIIRMFNISRWSQWFSSLLNSVKGHRLAMPQIC